MRSQASGPSPNALPSRTATSGETGFFSPRMSYRCWREMPMASATADLLIFKAGRISSRNSAPGWVGHLLGLRSAIKSAMTRFLANCLMILLEIHPVGALAVKLERDAPRPVDMNGITQGLPFQGMEIES